MSAEVVSLPRAGATVRPPLVPAGIKLDDADYLRLECEIADTAWIQMSQPIAALAGIVLRIRALRLKDHAGSLPDDDRFLAFSANFRSPTALQDWRVHKAEALEGWVLCSDSRWYLPEVARNVLHIWIGRLEDRRISAWGNISKKPRGGDYGIHSIQADISRALEALRAIDPQDRVLSKSTRQWHEWQDRIDSSPKGLVVSDAEVGDAEPNRSPIGSPNGTPPGGDPKVRQAKRSQKDSSSLRSRDDSSDHETTPVLEIEADKGSAKRTAGSSGPGRAAPWPPGWFETFRARGYPQRDNMAWGRAEKALDKIRKAQRVPFEDILAGIDRLAAQVRAGTLSPQYVPLPSTWLSDRGWEDKTAPRPVLTPSHGGRASPGHPGSEPSITQRAAMLAAERLGLLDEPRPRG